MTVLSGVSIKRMVKKELFMYARKVTAASFLTITAGLVAALVGVWRGREIAVHFGTGPEIDAFNVAWSLPNFLLNLFAGAFSGVFLPRFYAEFQDKGLTWAAKSLRDAIYTILLINAAILVVGVLGGYHYFSLLFNVSGEHAVWFPLWLSLFMVAAICMPVSQLFVGVLNGEGRFFITGVMASVIPATSLVFLLLFFEQAGIHALIVGTVLGYVAYLLCLLVPGWTYLRAVFSSEIPAYSGRTFYSAMQSVSPLLIAALILGLTDFIILHTLANQESGEISVYYYASRLYIAATGLGATAISTVLLPVFSSDFAQDKGTFRQKIATTSILLFFLGLVGVLAVWLLGSWLVALVYQGGQFDASDVDKVGACFRMLSIQLPFYLPGIAIARALSVIQRNSLMLMGNVISVLVLFVVLPPAISMYGISGVGVSLSIMYAVSFCFLCWCFFCWKKRGTESVAV